MVDTFYLHLEFAGKNAWSVNLPFVCNKCGNCCKLEDFLCAGKIRGAPEDYPGVFVALKELFGELGNIWELGERIYDEYVMHANCPFLVGNSCSVYEVRPEGCRLFPKTAFGMASEDCEPLIRFKRMACALRRGRKCVNECFFRTDRAVESVSLSESRFQSCVEKLRGVGMTDDELSVFSFLNSRKIM
jgi:Fe-S-cluster containining protein